MMWAAAKGRTDNIAVLAKNGANVNAVSNKGWTPVFFALQSRNADASHGPAGCRRRCERGASGRHHGDRRRHYLEKHSFATQIVARGADVNKRDARGWQLIHVAAASGDADFIKMVLAKGGDAKSPTTRRRWRSKKGGDVRRPAGLSPRPFTAGRFRSPLRVAPIPSSRPRPMRKA